MREEAQITRPIGGSARAIQEVFREYLPLIISVQLSVAALAAWTLTLAQIDLSAMNDYGLVSVLPWTFYLAIVFLALSFIVLLHDDYFYALPLRLCQVLLLIFILFGTAAIVEPAPRTAISVKLLGLIQSIRETGAVNPYQDAFNNWPGFFIFTAFFTSAAGIENTFILASWAPVILNVLYLAPLFFIFQAATKNKQLIWMGIWVFYLFNWIGQDYLSPQGFNYYFYLVILGVLLHWFRPRMIRLAQPAFGRVSRMVPARLKEAARGFFLSSMVPVRPSWSWQRAGLLTLVVVLFSAIVPSHQLTPFATIASVTALVILNRLTPRGLPVLMVVIAGTWITYMTIPYLSGHIHEVLGPIGSIGRNISENLDKRFTGSPEHVIVLRMRLATTLLLVVLAALGFYRRLSAGRTDLEFGILAFVPFSLIGLQVYGGELLLRSYFFALPFLSFLCAGLFIPTRATRLTWPILMAVGAFVCVMATSFFVTRHGNERMDYFTAEEVNAITDLYAIAEPGSQLIAVTDFLPWRFQGYAAYKYTTVWEIVEDMDINGLVNVMADPDYPASYLILTRSQAASAELYLGWTPEDWERFNEALMESGKFELMYENEHARIFILAVNTLDLRLRAVEILDSMPAFDLMVDRALLPGQLAPD